MPLRWLGSSHHPTMTGRYEFLYRSSQLVIIVYKYANIFTIAGIGEGSWRPALSDLIRST
ncbi:hypothetical protein [Paenibacillus harenae]|uniref:hypothetical protein n=1 Tax=Paenibacillus harenae TaxID=306543 RepID=UPI0003FB0E6A